jgi:hypothetical protein
MGNTIAQLLLKAAFYLAEHPDVVLNFVTALHAQKTAAAAGAPK